ENSHFEMRGYSLPAVENWSSDYHTPVFTGESTANADGANQGPTQIWLYNPGDDAIDVDVDFEGNGNDETITVPAGGSALTSIIPDGSGTRVASDDGAFFAITQTDTTGVGARNDWGHTLIPTDELTSQVIVGLGFGNTDQIDGGNSGDSRSVVWVTPTEDATINVDFDGDGVVDQTQFVDGLDSIKIADPDDQDMTGAVIFATDDDGEPVPIAAAYGQDPATPADESNSLDLGTTVLPAPELDASKAISLKDDADGDGAFSTGDTVTYTITVLNFGRIDLPVNGYTLTDFSAPIFDETIGDGNGPTEYLPGSTFVDFGNGPVPIADSGSGSAFPLDDAILNDEVLGAGDRHTYTFDVKIKDFEDLSPGTVDFTNEGQVINNQTEAVDDFTITTPLSFEAGIDIEKSTNGEDADVGPGPTITVGDTVTWTYEVTNTGNTLLADVEVTDDQGVIPVFVSGDTNDDGLLGTDETWIFEATDAAEAGQYTNLGTATANPVYADGTTAVPGLGPVVDEDPSNYVGEEQGGDPDILLIKSVVATDDAGNGILDNAGEDIDYQITVVNTGEVDLFDVTVTDTVEDNDPITLPDTPTFGDVDDDGVLDVGEAWVYQFSHTVSEQEFDDALMPVTVIEQRGFFLCSVIKFTGDGTIDNSATVTAKDIAGTIVTDEDTARTLLDDGCDECGTFGSKFENEYSDSLVV
ncbi:MAG: hypothetical protein AAGJ53_02865, partial [Pseudomonadota bacterium]